MSPSELLPILVIVGPTGSGKSSLGMAVAEALAGEIVSADACAVFRGMDIGTDKPSVADRARVPHHMVDVVEPSERYSAGAFARDGGRTIQEIAARGRPALVVGGSHFYVTALLRGLFPAPPRDPEIRSRHTAWWQADRGAVYTRLEEVDPTAAARIGAHDRQRILRVLEYYEVTGTPISQQWETAPPSPRFRALVTAVCRSLDELYVKIDRRVDRMYSTGLVDEVEGLLAAGVPAEAHALKAIGYRQVINHLHGLCTLADAIDESKRSSRKFARRQMAWLEGQRAHRVPPAEAGGASRLIDLWRSHSEEGRV